MLEVRPSQHRRHVEVLADASNDRRLSILGCQSSGSVGIQDPTPRLNQRPRKYGSFDPRVISRPGAVGMGQVSRIPG